MHGETAQFEYTTVCKEASYHLLLTRIIYKEEYTYTNLAWKF